MSIMRLLTAIRFWAIFWIDASSQAAAQQGFMEIARICGVEENPKVVRRWLSNIQDHWLLIIDNADDPSMDVSEFFPTRNRGSILLTTRNPDCKIHATVGSCELGKMYLDEAVTLQTTPLNLSEFSAFYITMGSLKIFVNGPGRTATREKTYIRT
jgi:hypothetical protein